MGLVRTVAPLNPPVTVEEAKQHLSLVEKTHDALVSRLVEAATECAEWTTWRALVTQTWRLTLHEFPCRLWVPRPPLQSVTSIQYVDTDGNLQTLDPSLYTIAADSQPAYIVPAYNQVWPATRCQPEAVKVTFVAGYGSTGEDVPQRIRQAILLIAGNWFANRESVQVGAGAVSELPQSARWLLEAFKTGVPAEWFLPGD